MHFLNRITLQTPESVELEFCLAMQEPKDYLGACKEYAKKLAKGEPEELFKLSTDMVKNFKGDEKVMKQAEVFAKEAAEKANKYEYYLSYANILNQNGKKAEALKAANKSLELAKPLGPGAVRSVEMLIYRLDG